ncbi:copper homeostasis protein CutC [Gluconacetobacter entanii]|uniref:copper homeostasis protein CutC n=1 Tax=Gluconacetobacter entanii TaxID=108528 RepID=UPI001C933838|nr:copper homeostasis protein CutC [Gluconacetobacter entanii]MBY4639033.1 copper homeostasis protein CutC [Gluconacetobacter entanii]MCW4580828.1 copper homeostasis protein CutC [Gluconacetobacter entanii]MCW4584157.1 copper homeostasis protein CutC [Gluconacetobacter entanii]MCW4587501.1 copper homeostasis protein CutC [Gluconacetobacter entanii]
MTRVEICVETPQGIAAANAAGADRIELCASLDVGGLTPSAGLMRYAARGTLPALAMIRPRAGSFVFDGDEAAIMVDDIRAAREAGLKGVVLGAMRPDGGLDHDLLLHLSDHCTGMERTLHRVFDLVRDPAAELEFAIRAGFTRILTSGQRPTAPQGADCLARLNALAAGRITVLAGSGVNAGNVAALIRATGVGEVHASCRRRAQPLADDGAFGFGPMPGLTDPDAIRALVAAARGAGQAAS